MQNKIVLLSGSGISFVGQEAHDGTWTVTLPPVSSLRLLLRRSVWERDGLVGRAQAMGFAELAGRAVVDGLRARSDEAVSILGRIAETRAAVRMAPDDSIRACLVAPLDPAVGESATKRRCLSLLEELKASTEVEAELVGSLAASAGEMRLVDASCEAEVRMDDEILVCRSASPGILAETLLGMIQLTTDAILDEEDLRSRLSVGGDLDPDALAEWLAERIEDQDLPSFSS